ncbi:MAG: hypothetical protein ABR991_09725, partial [Terracidiphilus sp.]
ELRSALPAPLHRASGADGVRQAKEALIKSLCIRARLQSCRKRNKIKPGFSPCGMFFKSESPLSTFNHDATAHRGAVEIESEGTARLRGPPWILSLQNQNITAKYLVGHF